MKKNKKNASIENSYDGYLLSDEFYKELSSFFFEMDTSGKRFVDSFIDAYVKHADEKTKRVSDVIVNTGFSKTVVEKSLKGLKDERQFVIKSFFGEMIEEVKKVCSRNKDMTMNIKGTYGSFTNIFYKLEPSTKQLTSQSFLDYMIKRGIVEKIDSNTIRFIKTVPDSHINTKDKMVGLFTDVMTNFIGTLIRNFNSKKPEDENFQQSYRSWHIDPNKHDEVREELTKLLRKQWSEVQNLIDSFEAQSEFEKNRFEKTGAEIGVSTFVFSKDNKKK